MEFTKEMAKSFAEWFEGTLNIQSTAQPCIYYHAGRVDFSPGSTTGGTAAPVYNEEAAIIINKEWWNDRDEFTTSEKADLIFDEVREFLDDLEEEEEPCWKNLIGSSDVARLLGWDIRKVSVYRGKELIPSPVTEIGGRPVWDRKDILRYAREKGIEIQGFKLGGDPDSEEWFLFRVDQEVTNPDYEEIFGEWNQDGDRSGWFTDEDSGCRIRVIRDGSGEWRTSGRWEE